MSIDISLRDIEDRGLVMYVLSVIVNNRLLVILIHITIIYISIDNNIYINDNVGKCNRLDKCGYHYTPKQYFEKHPQQLSSAGDFRFSKFQNHRVFENLKTEKTNQPRRIDYIPEEYWVRSRHNGVLPDHVRWLVTQYGVGFSYRVSSFMEGREQGADVADL